MQSIRAIVSTVAFVLLVPAAALAQTISTTAPTQVVRPKTESQATLAKEAKITLAAATATALKTVPGSVVRSHELEREGGKLIYSFDMKLAGKPGIEEVNVDAMTGATVGKVEHEADPVKPSVKKP
ncbi:MAG TPA: PepSY domain-containing protein [Gemmatimonadales bacterium]|jgi:uncharacterized membrane protein YkoI